MNTFLIIKQEYQNFSPVERKIADYILENGAMVLTLSAQEMAKKAGTSPAALVRFSRRIGLTGFTQLKQKISASLASMDSSDDFEEVKKDESVGSIKRKVSIRMNTMIEQTNDLLVDETVTRVSNLLDASDLIFVYGFGASGLVAQDIFQKFTRIGKQVFYVQDIHHFSSSLVALKENAVFIAISNSGNTKSLLRLCSIAQQNEIPIVGITSDKKSKLARMTNELLQSTSGDTFVMRAAATISLMAQLYVVDILFYTYLSNHYDDGMSVIQSTRDTILDLDQL